MSTGLAFYLYRPSMACPLRSASSPPHSRPTAISSALIHTRYLGPATPQRCTITCRRPATAPGRCSARCAAPPGAGSIRAIIRASQH